MNILGFKISRSRQQPAPLAKSAGFDCEDWLRGDDVVTGSGPLLSNAYEQVVWVYRAINVLAEQIGNIPFLFSSGERGRENLLTEGPLIDFYDHPHPQIDRFQYWELRIIWLMLRGECFRIPIYSDDVNRSGFSSGIPQRASRKLARIVLAPPDHFQHIIEDHQLIGWRYTGFSRETPLASQVFLPEEVWFEKLPNPFNFWRGLSPLRVAGLAAQTDFAAGAFMKGVMENNGDQGLIVRVQDHVGPEQREQLKAALRQRKRRAGTADSPLLLWNTAEIVQPQLSSGDLQFLENRKFSRAEICAAFGVPEEIVTTTDNSKYDVMEGARLNFIEHRVGPLCRRLEAGEDRVVKSFDPRAVGWFDLDSLPILQKAQRDRLATARIVFDMGVPFNELNRVLDLGFRRLPWGDRGYVASKLREIGEGLEGKPGAEEREPSGRETNRLEIRASAVPYLAETLSASGAREPLGRLSELFEKIQEQRAETETSPDEAGIAVPIRFVDHSTPVLSSPQPSPSVFASLRHDKRGEGERSQAATSRSVWSAAYPAALAVADGSVMRPFCELEDEKRRDTPHSKRFALFGCGSGAPEKDAPDRLLCSCVKSKLRRFIFEQRGRVLAGLMSVKQVNSLSTLPSNATCGWSSNTFYDALPNPEHAVALSLPSELTAEQTATLREKLRAEIGMLREEIATAFEEGLRQGRQPEQLAGCVRAIYNRKGEEMIERIMEGTGFRVQGSGDGR